MFRLRVSEFFILSPSSIPVLPKHQGRGPSLNLWSLVALLLLVEQRFLNRRSWVRNQHEKMLPMNLRMIHGNYFIMLGFKPRISGLWNPCSTNSTDVFGKNPGIFSVQNQTYKQVPANQIPAQFLLPRSSTRCLESGQFQTILEFSQFKHTIFNCSSFRVWPSLSRRFSCCRSLQRNDIGILTKAAFLKKHQNPQWKMNVTRFVYASSQKYFFFPYSKKVMIWTRD